MIIQGFALTYFALLVFGIDENTSNQSLEKTKVSSILNNEVCQLKYVSWEFKRVGCKSRKIPYPFCFGYCRSISRLPFLTLPKKESCRACIPTKARVPTARLFLGCNKTEDPDYIEVPIITGCHCQDTLCQ